MASFRQLITPSRRVAARFVGDVRRGLQRALADRSDIKQSDIAREIGVHRSVITRQLRGTEDMSLARVGEIAAILGYEPEIMLHKVGGCHGVNVKPPAVTVNLDTFHQHTTPNTQTVTLVADPVAA